MVMLFTLIPLVVLGGLIALAVSGFRALANRSRADDEQGPEPVDTAEAAKSFAIHGALFLSFLACAVGLIDLLQSAVDDQQLAGSSTDLARGLALLIVGAPVYALLLRVVGGRYAERGSMGDTQPHRGWTAYLIAALTVTLVGTLISVVQIADSVIGDFDNFEPKELMQLVVWFGLWLAHWFLLRPRFRVRGDVHLAIGSIVGLGFLLSGVSAVIYAVLATSYDSAFNHSLGVSFDTALWVVIGLAGAVVWAWHWLAHFNHEGSVEGDRRQSPLWFFTVVVAGVLPGLIAMLFSVTTMVSGVLIWFVGSTDSDAADFFDLAPALIAALFIGFVSWAYHRWELQRRGLAERNESLRFHDYVVLAVSLIGVVGAIATIFALLIDAASAEQAIARSLDTDNDLIVAVTVLAASAGVWWRQWSLVERHRSVNPVDESDSIWRKLYLIASFGVGGVVLSVSLIWVLFTFLRDLLDGLLGAETVRDLTGPIGWGVAVLGAVWYHLGVWRADRDVLAPAQPAPSAGRSPLQPPTTPAFSPEPPVPAPSVVLRAAQPGDYGELFTLQRAAAVSEAVGARTLDIPALHESLDEMTARLAASSTVVAIDGSRIVGSISRREAADGPGYRLTVAPDRANNGIATLLLSEVEASTSP